MTTVLRIFFFTFLALVVLLTMNTCAHAAAPTVEQDLQLAAIAWPYSTCGSHIDIVWWTDAQANAQTWAGQYGADGAARRDMPCTMALRRSLMTTDPYKLCDTIVHEAGHNAGLDVGGVDGHGHTNNGSVMDVGGGVYPPCHIGETSEATQSMVRTVRKRIHCRTTLRRSRWYRSHGNCYLRMNHG